MDITTIERMQTWIDEVEIKASTGYLANLITGVSARVEGMLGRYLKEEARTVYVDVSPATWIVWLRGYPVTTLTSVTEDTARLFTGSALDSTLYDSTATALTRGKLEFTRPLAVGPSALKVVYTGGMGTTTAALIAAFPGLVFAAEEQIYFQWKNRDMMGLSGAGGGQLSGNANRQINTFTWQVEWGDLLPNLKRAINEHRSLVPRW